MELSDTNDRYNQQLISYGIQRNYNVVMFQPKYLNSSPIADADKHYCRVIVDYNVGDAGDFLHHDETDIIGNDLEMALMLKVLDNVDSGKQVLSRPEFRWIDIDGIKAIEVKYRRKGNNGNTTACAMYYLFNYDEIAFLMTAYREQDESLWQVDMENVIKTFRWSQCK